MTQDEILEMAIQAGFERDAFDGQAAVFFPKWRERMEAFAKLVAAKEREACAKFIEDGYVRQFENPWREDLAAAIRERGKT